MRLLLPLFCLAVLAAQTPPAPEQTEARPAAGQAKPEEAKPAGSAQQAAEAESPAPPATEAPVTGSIEIGYRWMPKRLGNLDAYRSVVNLGEGPRLLGADLRLRDASKRFFDQLDLTARGWGGDPSSMVRIDAFKNNHYRLTFDHRDIAYFNALPTFANPRLEDGVLFSQHQFDIQRRLTDLEVEFAPGRLLRPFFGYRHNSGSGRGVTTFQTTGNEYPVSTQLDDRTNDLRGGVRLEAGRWHATLEQGGQFFHDDQHVFTSDRNPGNRSTPFLGRTLLLDTLDQKYAIEGRSYYARGLVSANPADWIELHGNFLFSQPRTETDYRASAAGVFGESNPPRFFEAINESLIAAAKQPHVSGAFSVELRPAARLRLLESFLTDRYHTASRLGLGATDRLELNYNQNQFDVLVDALPSLTLRGGHRYVFGDARTRAPGLSFGLPLQNTDLERNVLLAGLAYRPAARLSVHVDSEAGWSNNVYFRTSLRDYQRIRARATFQALASLALTANFGLLNNDSPTPGGGYLVRSRDAGLSVAWTPAAGKRVRLIGDYVRSTFRSEIDYLVPQELSRELSRYRDYAHQATALVDVAIPAIGGRAPRLSAGGSLFHTSGSRPTRYYQPLARFTAPIARHLEANFEWRWYAMSEAFYVFEGFRAHQLIFSLRIL